MFTKCNICHFVALAFRRKSLKYKRVALVADDSGKYGRIAKN